MTEVTATDTAVPDGAMLLRRINPLTNITPDGAGGLRPSSHSFDGDEMSVYVEDLLLARGNSADDVLAPPFEQFCLVAFSAGFVRHLGLDVQPDPVEGDAIGYAHAVVTGKKTRSILRRIAEACERRKWPAPT